MKEVTIKFNVAELFALQEMICEADVLGEKDDIRKTVMLSAKYEIMDALEDGEDVID